MEQDRKRHSSSDKAHSCWTEIREKLAAISANQEANKAMYSLHDMALRERGDHAGRINELEKTLRSRSVNAAAAAPHGRRASDVNQDITIDGKSL